MLELGFFALAKKKDQQGIKPCLYMLVTIVLSVLVVFVVFMCVLWKEICTFHSLPTHGVCVKSRKVVTNQGNKGLISADRRTKPTLVRTIPRYIVKSSTRDLSYPIFSIVISYDVAPKRILIQVTSGMVNINAFQHGF